MSRAVVWASLLLAACSSIGSYVPSTHVVERGETLYTIAWRYGVDYRALARWNGLANPDLIYAGQRLRLGPPAQTVAARQGVPAPSGPAPGRPRPLPDPPVLPAPAWAWPTPGPIVSAFGAGGAIPSGIAIAGREGQPVNAAAAGRVVYAGSGLIGYGQLVIIKHNDTYLSAYGHNSRVLVTQGQQVGRGEKIAEMGLDPEKRPRLHFEIRRNGVPVDPTRYLTPAR
jgi:lipoprotein NlpD